MEEYNRMLIEEYCQSHNDAASRRLAKLVRKSYDLSSTISDADALFLATLIDNTEDARLAEALRDLDDYYCV